MRKKRSVFRGINSPWCPSQEQNQEAVFWATPADLLNLLDNVGVVAVWSYTSALGNSLNEKTESLYIQISDLTNVLIKKGARGYFWIAGGDKICSLVECCSGFESTDRAYGDEYPFDRQYYLGHDLEDRGTLSEKWRLLSCRSMPDDQLIIGVNNKKEHFSCYARLKVNDFYV